MKNVSSGGTGSKKNNSKRKLLLLYDLPNKDYFTSLDYFKMSRGIQEMVDQYVNEDEDDNPIEKIKRNLYMFFFQVK
mgnify:CR=1 FL=1